MVFCWLEPSTWIFSLEHDLQQATFTCKSILPAGRILGGKTSLFGISQKCCSILSITTVLSPWLVVHLALSAIPVFPFIFGPPSAGWRPRRASGQSWQFWTCHASSLLIGFISWCFPLPLANILLLLPHFFYFNLSFVLLGIKLHIRLFNFPTNTPFLSLYSFSIFRFRLNGFYSCFQIS